MLLISGAASAQTDVPAGNLSGDQTWVAAGSPYVLAGEVRVPPGVTLSVAAGAQVQLPYLGRLFVEGHLDVTGSAAAPAAFFYGAGIFINDTGTATIRNATVNGADTGLTVNTTGAVAVFDTQFDTIIGSGIVAQGNPASVLLGNVSVRGAVLGLQLSGGTINLTADRLTINFSAGCVEATSVTNVTIRNFRFTGCSLFGVQASLANGFALEDGNLSEWAATGMAFLSSSGVRIANSSFYTSVPATAINLTGVSGSTVVNNSISMAIFNRLISLLEPPIAVYDLNPLGPNRIERNNITAFHIGIRVQGAIFGQVVEANTIGIGWDTGIELMDSPNQTVKGNRITQRDYPFAVNVTSPATPWYYRQFVDGNNTVEGRSILYVMDRVGGTVDLAGGAGIVALVDSNNVTLQNGNLTKGTPSLLIANSQDIVVRDSVVQSNTTGLYVYRSVRVLTENLSINGGLTCVRFRDGLDNRADLLNTSICLQSVLTEGRETNLVVSNVEVNGTAGLVFFEGVNLTLRDAFFATVNETAITNSAIRLGRGGQSIVTAGKPEGVLLYNVTIEGSKEAIRLENFSMIVLRNVTVTQAVRGATLRHMSGVLIDGSAISGKLYGVWADNLTDSRVENSSFQGAAFRGIFCVSCTNVTFRENLFAGNGVGVSFVMGGGCVVTRNLFFFNTLHAAADGPNQDFDDGATGNLWDDYEGLDANGDGIGDTPYPIATGVDYDRFPIAAYPDAEPPVANAGDDVLAYEDTPVLLSGYLSTDNVGIRAYLWSFDENGENVTVAGRSTRYWFYTPGVYLVTLTVIDYGGHRATDTLVATVLDRTAPHADAGGNRTVDEDVPFALDAGRSFDNDPRFPAGSAFTWYIYDTNGTALRFGSLASWTFATPGNYTVLLFVDDASGFSDDDSIVVTVRDRTAPVVPPLDAPLATEDAPFRVYGSAANDNDPLWPVGMTWWFELWRDGVQVGGSNESPAIFNVSEPGPYTALYFVGDAAGNTGSNGVTFNVADVTPPDVKRFGDRNGEAGEPVAFDISPAEDNDPAFPAGANATWTISIAAGRVTLAGAAVTYAFATIGDYQVAVHIRDASGNLAETSFVVHVRDSKAPVVIVTGPSTVEAGSLATFTANATDASDLAEFVWSVTGLATPRLGSVLNYRFFAPGSYQVRVHVEDRLGHGTNVSVVVDVVDTSPPTVVVEFDPVPHGGQVNLTQFDFLVATFLGTDNSALAGVEWSWGDGNVSNGTMASHAYAVPGNYTVLVRAADAFGNVNTTTARVHVEAQPATPPDQAPGAVQPTVSQFPTVAVVAVLAAGVAGGLALGFRAGKGRRKPDEKEP